MGGKKWCEYCRINIQYNKEAIQRHEETRLHNQNKQKQIKFQRHQIRKQNKQNSTNKKSQNIIAPKSSQNIPNTIITPKIKISEQKQEQLRKYQDEIKSSAMSRIHSLIAQKTKGVFGAPVQFPEGNLLLTKQSYLEKNDNQNSNQSDEDDIRMWRIDICPDTGKACFINNITGMVKYQKPVGFILSEEEQKEWTDLLQYCEENPLQNPDQKVNIGEWQEVKDEQNIFVTNAIGKQQQQQEIEQVVEKPKSDQQKRLQLIQSKIASGQVKTAEQVFDLMLEDTLKNESVRQKNEKLKQLIQHNFEQTVQMNKFKESEETELSKVKGFQARKKVKKVLLTTQQDL